MNRGQFFPNSKRNAASLYTGQCEWKKCKNFFYKLYSRPYGVMKFRLRENKTSKIS